MLNKADKVSNISRHIRSKYAYYTKHFPTQGAKSNFANFADVFITNFRDNVASQAQSVIKTCSQQYQTQLKDIQQSNKELMNSHANNNQQKQDQNSKEMTKMIDQHLNTSTNKLKANTKSITTDLLCDNIHTTTTSIKK